MSRAVDVRLRFQSRDKSRLEERRRPGRDDRKPRAESRPEDEVVHVSDVAARAESLLDEPVEPAQVEVGEVLRGQAADRQPAPRRDS